MVSVVAWPQFGQVSVDCSAELALLLAQQDEAEATVIKESTMRLKQLCFGQERRLKNGWRFGFRTGVSSNRVFLVIKKTPLVQ